MKIRNSCVYFRLLHRASNLDRSIQRRAQYHCASPARHHFLFFYFCFFAILVPGRLSELEPDELCLQSVCRKAIRSHMLNVNLVNLFIRIPHIGLPALLTDYLLYGQSLDEDDWEENNDTNDDTANNVDKPSYRSCFFGCL